MTLTVTQLRGHLTTSLDDAALGLLLSAAYEAIEERARAAGNLSESIYSHHSGPLLMLSHTAASIVSITEAANGAALALDPSDYFLRPSGGLVERLDSGANPSRRWRGRVDVVLVPLTDDAERDRVAIELVQLELNFSPGAASETIGAWSESSSAGAPGDYPAQREAILDSLHAGQGVGVY